MSTESDSFLLFLDVLVIFISYCDWITSILVTYDFGLNAKTSYFLLYLITFQILIFSIDYLFGLVSLLTMGYNKMPKPFLHKMMIYFPSIRYYLFKYPKYFGSYKRSSYSCISIFNHDEYKNNVSQMILDKTRLLYGYIAQMIIVSIPLTITQIITYTMYYESKPIDILLLKTSIIFGIISICIRSFAISYEFIMNYSTLLMNWLCNATDIFLIFTQIIFLCIYYDKLFNIWLFKVLIGVIPITFTASITFSHYLCIGMNNEFDIFRIFIICICCLFLIPFFIAIPIIILLEFTCFMLLEYFLYYIGHSRLPNSCGVHKFYRKIYEWAVLEAKEYNEDILEISMEQDMIIRLCCFHKHCSYFIKNDEFKEFIMNKGEHTGYLDVNMDELQVTTWQRTKNVYFEYLNGGIKRFREDGWSHYKLKSRLYLYFGYILTYFTVPLYLCSRIIHILWPFIILLKIPLSEMNRFEHILWSLSLILIFSTLISVINLFVFMGSKFYLFLWDIFPHSEVLPTIVLPWGYFEDIPKLYKIIISIPQRNALLNDKFGKDITTVILLYLESMALGMPASPGIYA